MTNSPHDHLAKEVFSRPGEARSLVRAFLPERYLQALDLDSLDLVRETFIDRRLRYRHSDLLFAVKMRDRPVLVYLLFEHKSYQDRWLVLQLLIYVTRIWARWRRDHGDDCRLPMILPIVLYHGASCWSQPLELIDLCDVSGSAREILGPAQPTLPLTIIDLGRVSESQLEKRLSSGTALATLTLLLMKSIRDTGILERFRSWRLIIQRTRGEVGGRDNLEMLLYYLLVASREEVDPDELQDVLSQTIGAEAEELVMNTGEKLIQQGEERGLKKGLEQGMRAALVGVLRARFGEIPESIQSVMDTADLDTLQRYLDRAITARSVHEVCDN